MTAVGFPDATNTGVRAVVALTPHYGNLGITTSGTVTFSLSAKTERQRVGAEWCEFLFHA
jgi:hypothetical protein